MKRLLLAPLLIAGLISFSLETYAEQFGLKMGETVNSLKKKGIKVTETGAKYTYSLNQVPKGNKKLKLYRALITPNSGLCQLTAMTEFKDYNSFGLGLKTDFQFFEKALNKKYGQNKKVDDVIPRSIWNKPEDWMMGLYKKERMLVAYWDKSTKANLPLNNIGYIQLRALAGNPYKGVIALRYDFINHDECLKEQDEASTSNL